ncbi:hypothetical protein R6Q57_014789 [Mikania cordata]
MYSVFLTLFCKVHGGDFKRKALQAIILTACYCIWKVMEDIKTLSFLWVNNRSKMNDIDWSKWYKFDLKYEAV